MDRPSRRQFVVGAAGLGLVAGCGRWPWQGQQAAKVPRIGYLGGASAGGPTDEAFLEGLRALGYVEGQNIGIDWRFAEGRAEVLPQFVAELISTPVELILASGPSATLAAKQATTTLPIVMCFGGDPLELGLIASMAHPGGNVTGIAALTSELGPKRLQLFAETLPGIARVAVLWDATAGPSQRARIADAARSLELQLQALEVRGPDELDGALAAASAGHAEGLFVTWDPMSIFNAYRRRIADFAVSGRLPVTGGTKDFAQAGALLTYGANFPSMYRRAASHVDKILKGANPADLPIEQPMTFDFVVNMKTAQALGITFPNEIMLQVTEVIQ
jgi:putative ABC transport system substrate-binding protein